MDLQMSGQLKIIGQSRQIFLIGKERWTEISLSGSLLFGMV